MSKKATVKKEVFINLLETCIDAKDVAEKTGYSLPNVHTRAKKLGYKFFHGKPAHKDDQLIEAMKNRQAEKAKKQEQKAKFEAVMLADLETGNFTIQDMMNKHNVKKHVIVKLMSNNGFEISKKIVKAITKNTEAVITKDEQEQITEKSQIITPEENEVKTEAKTDVKAKPEAKTVKASKSKKSSVSKPKAKAKAKA